MPDGIFEPVGRSIDLLGGIAVEHQQLQQVTQKWTETLLCVFLIPR